MKIHIWNTTIFLLGSLLLFSVSVFGQNPQDLSTSTKRFPISHQVGLNGTTLLKQFLSFGDSSTVQSPYLLTYKFAMGPFAFRTGVGGKLRSESVREEGYADSEKADSYFVEARAGLEYQASMGNRWQGSFGIDGIGFGGETRQISDTGFDKVTSSVQTKGWGVGPVIGLRFFVSEKFSLYTEGAMYYSQSERVRSRLFTNFPQFDDQLDEATIKDVRLLLPATIYLIYQF